MYTRTMKNNVIERKGVNVYGQPCIERIVIVEKETAIQQYMESMEVLRNATENIEYTFDCRNLSKEEEKQFGKMIECITRTYEKNYR